MSTNDKWHLHSRKLSIYSILHLLDRKCLFIIIVIIINIIIIGYFAFLNLLSPQSSCRRQSTSHVAKSLPCCPRDLLLNKAKADWLTGWENDKGWGGLYGGGGVMGGTKLSREISMHTKQV